MNLVVLHCPRCRTYIQNLLRIGNYSAPLRIKIPAPTHSSLVPIRETSCQESHYGCFQPSFRYFVFRPLDFVIKTLSLGVTPVSLVARVYSIRQLAISPYEIPFSELILCSWFIAIKAPQEHALCKVAMVSLLILLL